MMNSAYDIGKTYDENYDHGPFYDGPFPERIMFPKKRMFLGYEINTPLGIAAGPLLNSNWIEFYGKMGFDVLTYKTVRSVGRKVHPWPNCVYLDREAQLKDVSKDGVLESQDEEPRNIEQISITNSFGMPCASPQEWMADIKKANDSLGEGQVMVVSITGTPGVDGRDLQEDFVYTAKLAKEAGAKIIEANYSCPNVVSGEGKLYMNPEGSAAVSKAIKAALGDTPFMIKLGDMPYETLKAVVEANVDFVDCFAGINTLPRKIVKKSGEQALPGETRSMSGVCGNVIRDAAQEFTENLVKIREELGADFQICGVGGMMNSEQMFARLDAGADIIMTATSAMWDPLSANRFAQKLLCR